MLLTAAAMVGFAANSLLCRAALRGGAMDAASFTAVRLASGALMLFLITRIRRVPATGGSWQSALALAAYAVTFAYAYVRIGAGAGALILFGAVQLTMIAGAIARGERPLARQWLGLAVGASGL